MARASPKEHASQNVCRVPGTAGMEQTGRLAPQANRASKRPVCTSPWEPARYDLGELYAKYLQGRRGGDDEQSRKRIRRAERFQVFLALAAYWPCWPIHSHGLTLGIVRSPEPGPSSLTPSARRGSGDRARQPALPAATAFILIASFAGISRADNPAEAVRDGLRWYGKGDFDKARDKFGAAREQFDSGDAGKAAIAVFDQACLAPRIRKGDVAQAQGVVSEGWSRT